MWARIVLKPWWARALAVAGVDTVLEAVYWCAGWIGGYHLADNPQNTYHNVLLTFAVQAAGVVIFGLLVAASTLNSHQAYTNALAGLDPAQRSAAIDASFRGPVPVDAPVRDAAIRVAWRRLYVARFWRVMWLVLLGLILLAADVGLALGTWPSYWGPDDWVNFAVIPGFTIAAWYVSLSVKHRLQTLGQTQIQSPFGTATSSAPGWYADPHDGNLMRYFDGRMWTSSSHPRSY
jgi:hypothetical protein